ncbi:hypothetical protein BHM03_00028372 [Ensete ventricosum]|nr:hypothetical protein BHM03_00028372 [Ensete ventricosum]
MDMSRLSPFVPLGLIRSIIISPVRMELKLENTATKARVGVLIPPPLTGIVSVPLRQFPRYNSLWSSDSCVKLQSELNRKEQKGEMYGERQVEALRFRNMRKKVKSKLKRMLNPRRAPAPIQYHLASGKTLAFSRTALPNENSERHRLGKEDQQVFWSRDRGLPAGLRSIAYGVVGHDGPNHGFQDRYGNPEEKVGQGEYPCRIEEQVPVLVEHRESRDGDGQLRETVEDVDDQPEEERSNVDDAVVLVPRVHASPQKHG